MDQRPDRVVVKLGTNTLTGDDHQLDQAFLDRVADQVVALRGQGYEVLVVSSGAIGGGMGLLGRTERVREVRLRQALAAMGQPHLMGAWEQAFGRHGVHVAQLLLTYDALRDRKSFLNMRNATDALLELGVVPVVNENDTVSIEEIEGGPGEASFGDNDKLSAYVATKARAGLLVILSDVDGLYTRPPDHPEAQLVSVVERIDDEVRRMASPASSSVVGRGGMASKLEAARIATEAGVEVVIANGRTDDVLARVVQGAPIGTRFLAAGEGSEKERWLTIARAQGRVRVDEGAAAALARGNNLLPAGVTGVEGSFGVGAVVELVQGERVVGKAIAQLSAKELEVVKGLHSDQARKRLGRDGSCNVTRKNEVVLG